MGVAGASSRDGDDWLAVVDGLVKGDRLAFARFNRLVTGFLLQLRAYDFREEWDDLRQEVVLAVLNNARAGRLRDPQALVGYIRIITRNKFFDRLKRRDRDHEGQALPWDEETARSRRALTDPGPSQDIGTEGRELWSAVGELPEEQRAIIDGIYREGRTYQEVSDATGIPLGTVKRRLRDSLTVLRRRFGAEIEDG